MNDSIIKIITIVVMLLSSNLFAQGDWDINVPQSSAEKFNSRGLFDNDFISQKEKESISDYDGNFMLTYGTSLDFPDKLSSDFTIIFNSNVGHKLFKYNAIDIPDGWELNGPINFRAPASLGYNINAPEWILGYKGIALQTFNFETHLYNRLIVDEGTNNPPYTPGYLRSEWPLLISGYHITNRTGEYNLQWIDNIRILRADGSTIELQNINSMQDVAGDGDGYNHMTGLYTERGVNKYGYAIVKWQEGSNFLRKMWYKPGDGLTYYFEEEFPIYTEYIGEELKNKHPKIMYLKKIESPSNSLIFEYENSNNNSIHLGRKLFKRIIAERSSSNNRIELEVNYDYDYYDNSNSTFLVYINNLQKEFNYSLDLALDSATPDLFSSQVTKNKNKTLRVKKISDNLDRTDVIQYTDYIPIDYYDTQSNFTGEQKRQYWLTGANIVMFDFYLPKEIKYHTGKRTELEYYYQKFDFLEPLCSQSCYLYFAPLHVKDNLIASKRDCFTNFMLKSRKIYNNYSDDDGETPIKTEYYNYYSTSPNSGEDDFKSEEITDIITEITIEDNIPADLQPLSTLSSGSGRYKKIIKNFTKYTSAEIDRSTYDHGSEIKLISQITGESFSKDPQATLLAPTIKKTYDYDHTLVKSTDDNDVRRTHYKGPFYTTSIKEEKGNLSKITSIKYGELVNGNDYQNINYSWDGVKLTKQIKLSETITDSQLFEKKISYKHFDLTGIDLKTVEPETFYYHLELPEEIIEFSGSKVKSSSKNIYYESDVNIGRLKDIISNYSTKPTTIRLSYDTNGDLNGLLSSIKNVDSGVEKVFYYDDIGSPFNGDIGQPFDILGKIVKSDNSISSELLFAKVGFQDKPIKTSIKLNDNDELLDYYTVFNDQNKLMYEIDANGYYTNFEYDAIGRVTKANFPGSYESTIVPGMTGFIPNAIYSKNSIIYNYDDTNNILLLKKSFISTPNDDKKVVNKIEYDALGQVRKHSVNTVEKLTKEYDYQGLVKKEITGGLYEAEYSYHPLTSKVEKVSYANGAKNVNYHWESGSLKNGDFSTGYFEWVEYVDEIGNKRQEYYDIVGNKVAEHSGELPENDTDDIDATIFNYNEIYQLTEVITPEGITTTYQYDDLGNIKYKKSPDFGIYEYIYDKYGNLRFEKHSSSSEVIYYNYDPLNRLVSKGIIGGMAWSDFKGLEDDPIFNQGDLLLVNIYDQFNTTNDEVKSIPLPKNFNTPDNLIGRLSFTKYRDTPQQEWKYKIYSYDYKGRVKKLHVNN